MKRTPSMLLLPLLFLSSLLLIPKKAQAQAEEAQQLLLNVEKLAQLKNILADMKTGYDIIYRGYGTVKDLSEGNFSLHDGFLNGLLDVSPAVRKYKRVVDILDYQRRLVAEGSRAYDRFRRDGQFTPGELAYMGRVYASLASQSLRHLDELLLIISAGELRMSDAERLAGIDRLFRETEDRLLFLRHFNRQAGLLALQRAREQHETQVIRELYELTP